MKNGFDKDYKIEENTRSLFGLQMRFKMSDGFPAVTTKKLYFKMVKGELLWFISGSSDNRDLQKLGVHIWDDDAEKKSWRKKRKFKGDLGRVYGIQWRSWRKPDGSTIDQLGEMIKRIKQKPDDRRHIVTAWNPGELEEMALPACHILYQFYVAGNKLSLQAYQRSADMFLGVPFNIASYSLLLHMVAQILDLEPYEFVHIIGDAHIYHNHFDQVEELLKRKSFRLPKLRLNEKIRSIDGFRMDDIKLDGYKFHPPIKAKMSINTDFNWKRIT